MDVLNLTIDLTQRPANPPAYAGAVEALLRQNMGCRLNPILLLKDSVPEPSPFRDSTILKTALRISGRTNEQVAASVPMALGNSLTLLLSSGAWVAPDWLLRARDRWVEGDPLSIVFPEIGVFQFRGYSEFVSYASQSGSRHQSACLGVSEFAPVSFGSGSRIGELFSKGAFLGDPFSRQAWLQSWIDRGLGRLVPVERSAFFTDHSISELLKNGTLKRHLAEGETEIPWLKEELQKLRALDPRVPSRGLFQLSVTGWPIRDDRQQLLSALEEALPRNAIGIAVIESKEPGIEKKLIDSAAKAFTGGTLCALITEGEGREETRIGSVIVLRLGIKRELAQLGCAERARILLSLLTSANPRNTVLFESPLCLELAKAIAQSRANLERATLTLLPDGGRPTPVHRDLARPEVFHDMDGVRILAFDADLLPGRSMRAYGGAFLKVVSPWAPWEWRAEAFGLPSDRLPDIQPDDLKIPTAVCPYSSPGGRQNFLGIEGVLEASHVATEPIATPVPSLFLSGYEASYLPDAKFLIARDGALALKLFFSKNSSPDQLKPKILIPQSMKPHVPPAWREHVLFFRFRSKQHVPATPSHLTLCGLGYPLTCSLSQLENALSHVVSKLGNAGASIPIQCYFPQMSPAWGCESDPTYIPGFVRIIRKVLRGHEISWLDSKAFAALEAKAGMVFAEINPGLFFSVSAQSQALLSKGIPDLLAEADDRVPAARFVASSSHWIEAFEDSAWPEAENQPSLREICEPITRHWLLTEVLHKGASA